MPTYLSSIDQFYINDGNNYRRKEQQNGSRTKNNANRTKDAARRQPKRWEPEPESKCWEPEPNSSGIRFGYPHPRHPSRQFGGHQIKIQAPEAYHNLRQTKPHESGASEQRARAECDHEQDNLRLPKKGMPWRVEKR